jgi:hypothetical protein
MSAWEDLESRPFGLVGLFMDYVEILVAVDRWFLVGRVVIDEKPMIRR